MGLMISVLDDIYRCDFSRLEDLVVQGVHDLADLAGPSWAEYRICLKARKPKMTCLKEQEELCKKSDHIVSKVLRVTTGALEKLMESRPKLKVLQLFRNPIAIINSRTESKGYPVKDFAANAKNLCQKMFWDYQGSLELQKRFPNRVKMIFYEDLKSDVASKMKKLTSFVGMEYDEQEISSLNKVKTNAGKVSNPKVKQTRISDNAHWWRTHISMTRYKQVTEKCQDVIKAFNLTQFEDNQRLTNLAIPEMVLPQHLRI